MAPRCKSDHPYIDRALQIVKHLQGGLNSFDPIADLDSLHRRWIQVVLAYLKSVKAMCQSMVLVGDVQHDYRSLSF